MQRLGFSGKPFGRHVPRFGEGPARLAHRHSVLVIEDDPDTREGLMVLVDSRGVDAVGAANGREALKVLRRGLRPCLILLDLVMPEMDGLHFREAQLADSALAAIPVLVCSVASPDVVAKAKRLGIRGVTAKPPDWDDIVRAIDDTCVAPTSGSG